jgi:hypothetical protein
VESAIEKGRDLPDWYLEEPEIGPAEGFYMRAFWDLSTCRSTSFSVGPIPWTAIVQYGTWQGLDPLNHAAFVRIIRDMDREYQEVLEAQAKRHRQRLQSPQPSPPAGRGRRPRPPRGRR